MTVQIPDTCTFDGRRWAIEKWDGDHGVVPTNEELGIVTTTASTANWGGRIDHFTICKRRLYLLKIEVMLARDQPLVLPKGAQREVLYRYETMHLFDNNGEREDIREHRFEYLVFHDLKVPYTGGLYLSRPYIDLWDQPLDADDADEARVEMVMSFHAGVLVNAGKL